MLELKSNQPPGHQKQVFPSSSSGKVEESLEALQRSDRSLDNLIGMEVWSIAKTMDDFYPGFWNQFMLNRRLAMKQFMQQKQRHRKSTEIFPENHD